MDPNSRGSVDHVTCLRGLVGEMKEGRKHLVHQVPSNDSVICCCSIIVIISYCTYQASIDKHNPLCVLKCTYSSDSYVVMIFTIII